jgi:hypothetical protein
LFLCIASYPLTPFFFSVFPSLKNPSEQNAKLSWQVFGDVSATPTVVDGSVYVVDWGDMNFLNFSSGAYLVGNGHLTAINADTGA